MEIRPVFTLSLLLTAMALSAVPASAQNMTGTWQIQSRGRQGSVTQTLIVQQEGSTLTGTISPMGGGGPRGGGRGGGEAVEISNGTVDGASFSFTVTFEFGGRGSVSRTYAGTYEGDFMEGTFEGPRGGGQPFMGTRGD
jgi:hypothetical protein